MSELDQALEAYLQNEEEQERYYELVLQSDFYIPVQAGEEENPPADGLRSGGSSEAGENSGARFFASFLVALQERKSPAGASPGDFDLAFNSSRVTSHW